MKYLMIVATLLLCASTAWGGFGYGRVVGGNPAIASKVTVTDNFTGTGALSANWTKYGTGSLERVSDECKNTISDTDANAIYTGATFAANQYAQIKVTGLPEPTILLRFNGSTGNGYNAKITSTYVVVNRVTGWTASQLGNSFSSTISTGDVIKLTVSGTTLEVFKNGVSLGTVTDSTYSSGSPGIRIYATVGKLDDFEAGDL